LVIFYSQRLKSKKYNYLNLIVDDTISLLHKEKGN
jgi:hypothetical protein